MDDLRRLIRSRSRIFDLETGGTEEKIHPLVEGGVLDLRSGRLRRTVFSFGLREEGRWRPLTQEQFLESMDPWSRAKFAEGGPWRPFLQEQGRMPADWLRRQVVEPVARGEWVWAHNARFDLKFLAQNLTEAGYQRLTEGFPEELLSPKVRRFGKLHVTAGKRTFNILQSARRDPQRAASYFVESWQPFVETLKEAARQRQGLLLDTHYVQQVALAHAQEAGLMKATQDVFTGSSVEAYRMAFQRSFPGPAHTVGPDIRATGALLEDYLDIIQRLRRKQELTSEQLRALRFHEELQPRLFPENTFLQFLRARQRLLQHRPFEYRNLEGKQLYSWNLLDLLHVYKGRRQIYGYQADVEAIYQRVKNLTQEEIEQLLAEKDVRLRQILQEAWEASESATSRGLGGFRQSRWSASRLVQGIRNRPFLSLAAGIGAVMLGLSLIPGKDDDYNTIEGLRHGWFGKTRTESTDFGSGYRDSEASRGWLSKTWEWTKTHWPSLAIITSGVALGMAARHIDMPVMRSLHAYTNSLSARIAAQGENRGFFTGLFYKVGSDIVKYPISIGTAFGAAAAYEGLYQDDKVKATDVAKAVSLATVDLADDLLYYLSAKVVRKVAGGEHSPLERLLQSTAGRAGGNIMAALGAATVGLAFGKASGMVIRWERQKRQREEAGQVQRLHRSRINHQRMNGY